ncbi:uncharacterized protein LOC112638541 isoform X2 [Camponotus floridanus]|uniref:uncharacterized protein LOC112638541 isoform X2 n=1 Tax=Camponotus floridanus TaxID=104421 RepID=UPI000DC6B14A|nr:uncharacterized protein LOC112638541 isoform X2 [Camponotus floridanus]
MGLYRYVYDVVLAAPSSMLSTILDTFNSFHTRLQFTMEESADNRLNFLDVTIILEDGLIHFNWFHKPTFSGRYLHFESRHPLCQKMVGYVRAEYSSPFLIRLLESNASLFAPCTA